MTDAQPGTATPWRRDATQLELDLTRWARSVHGSDARVTDVRLPASGMANDTVMFSLDGDALAARLAPAPGSPYPTFPTYDLDFQERVMHLVRSRTTVPVPEVVHLERSDAWLGAPFLVTRAIEGVVASDNPPYLLDPTGWFLQGTPEQWRRFETSTIGLLVQLHRVVVGALDWEMAGIGPPEVDLAWVTFFQRMWASMGEQFGLPAPALFDRATTVATYERLSGDTLDDLAWYEALGGLRLGIILARMTLRSAAFGLQALPDDPDGLVMFKPLLVRLLEDVC